MSIAACRCQCCLRNQEFHGSFHTSSLIGVNVIKVLEEKLRIAVELVTSLQDLIGQSMDSEHNYSDWREVNKDKLEKIKAK